ncbi:MAG: exo-alpha-sialidase, partial [Ignavibacteriaceae bacterium]|nr:exo-alpha-sialidase [Ignavibacteriaceae bacterium]
MNYIFKEKRFNNPFNLAFFLIIIFLFSPTLIYSQSNQQEKGEQTNLTGHHEIKDDDYVPDLRDSQQRSPAYNFTMSNITTAQVNVDGNGQNIVGDAANEPSIAVDPTERNKVVIGWRQFNTVSSNFRQAGFGFSTNGGQTWTFPGVIQPGIFRSDPVLDADKDGNIFYNSLTNSPTFLCDVFKSGDGGASWNGGTFAQG